ncbi:MAG: hypothetical protein M3374_01750 [Pseudomonadota bacterium]|nr:hypothetical protein [Pseudomonadota bacterium]
MTDIVLRNIDAVLADRIRRVAEANGWASQDALMHLLEHGLFACEGELAGKLNDSDAMALQAAIAALEQVPSDPGFALIGRAPAAPSRSSGPDQSIAAELFVTPLPGDRLPVDPVRRRFGNDLGKDPAQGAG